MKECAALARQSNRGHGSRRSRPSWRMAMRLGICERGWTRPGADVRSLVQEMVDSARHVEQLGFGRFWLGEHHHVQTGWTVPDTLVSLVGAATSRITIGIGGVLMTGRNPYRTALD